MTNLLPDDSPYQKLFETNEWELEHMPEGWKKRFISLLEAVAHGDFGDVWEVCE